jgi:MFS transporter, DHA2 family, methylenomycin A resistance protein
MGGSIAAAADPIIGGALSQVDWRIIFYLNLPVGIIALLVLGRVEPSPRHDRPFDWTGQIAAVAGLAALTYAIIEGCNGGFGRPAATEPGCYGRQQGRAPRYRSPCHSRR